jgi:TonB-dependent SusC/RagA subfamily outer membrane receptor
MNTKIFAVITALGLTAACFGQVEKEVASSITRVTVFTQGAQIENEATAVLQPGQTIVKLTGLSPYLKKESIRVEGDGSFTILNVQAGVDYLTEKQNQGEIATLQDRADELKAKVEDEETYIKIQRDKLEFLAANRDITGSSQPVSPESYKALTALYGDNVEAVNLNILKRQRQIAGYQKELKRIENQLAMFNQQPDTPAGTISVTLESTLARTVRLKFLYRIDQASWIPGYDIRYMGLNKPLNILYKANIRQKSGIDWKNVNMVLSTAKTDISAQMPAYEPYYLQFYEPRVTDMLQGRVAGMAVAENRNPYASDTLIRIRGIGSLRIDQPLYVVDGMLQEDISNLNADEIQNMEVLKDASATSIYGSRATNGVVLITTKKQKQSSLPATTVSRRETSDEYAIESVQTVLSDNKTVTISYRELEIAAGFEYQSIPFRSENVYLIARIPDWYKADFLNGEANLYLENAFVGKSVIQADAVQDTLEISFGTDNRILVKREPLPGYRENQLVGSNRKESIGYRISVRNNKTYAVTLKVTDQIPVSTTREIQVDVAELSGGMLEEESGKVTWELKLGANESEDLLLKYVVKYPKDKRVVVE